MIKRLTTVDKQKIATIKTSNGMLAAISKGAWQNKFRNKQEVLAKSFDISLLIVPMVLIGLGLVMITSTSLHLAQTKIALPMYYFQRQSIYILVGLCVGAIVYFASLKFWRKSSVIGLLLGIFLLVIVLIPGVAREINGSVRWLSLGWFNIQVSEFMKIAMVIYMARYISRYSVELGNSAWSFVRPMMVVGFASVLLLLEPDFGAAVVMVITVLSMLFLAGARLWPFASLLGVCAGLSGLLIWFSPYRWQRLSSFVNPWANPYDNGFQLTQSLIAFGRGEWFGVGLGDGVQKLYYLPEAHTDFLLAVLAEEMGLFATLSVIALFAFIVWRAFVIGWAAEQKNQRFAAFLAYGLGLLLGFEAFINMGVNMGLLPTKGLALPFMSYGGSSMLASCCAIALLLRVQLEICHSKNSPRSWGCLWSRA